MHKNDQPKMVAVPYWALIALHYIKGPLCCGLIIKLFNWSLWPSFLLFLETYWTSYNVWIYVFCTTLVCHTVYLAAVLFFLVSEKTQILNKYRVTRKSTIDLKRKLQTDKSNLAETFFNHCFFLPLSFYFLFWIHQQLYLQVFDQPQVWEAIKQIFFGLLWFDTWVYWSHRCLHSSALYFLHKRHHEATAPNVLDAEYAHPLENVIQSLTNLPFFVLFNVHLITWWVWLAFRLVSMYETHSGFMFSFSSGLATEFHEYHHTQNIGCYGSIPTWDFLMDTCSKWRYQLADKIQFPNYIACFYIIVVVVLLCL